MVPDLNNCLSIKEKLKREENKFIHLRAETLCQKKFPHSFQLLGRKIGPFKVGHTYTMENYIARIFVESGYLTYTDEYHVNSKTIQKINFEESTERQLKKIKDLIYIQSREQMKIAKTHYENEDLSYRLMKQLFSDVNDLISVRLAKIGRLARFSKNLDAKKKLTDEELILFQELRNSIQEWQDYLRSPEK